MANQAGIAAGDGIVQIDGTIIKGKRASDLKQYMHFEAGQSRNLKVRRPNGEEFEARLTKPKE